jgi:hypothetical protein
LPSPVYLQEGEPERPDAELVLEKSNEIMRDIYDDILKVKDKYKELKDFGEGNYKQGHKTNAVKGVNCFGYCPPWELADIRYPEKIPAPGSIWFNIRFSEVQDQDQMACPYMTLRSKVYIKELRLYLDFDSSWLSDDSSLRYELIKIVNRNAKLNGQKESSGTPAHELNIVSQPEEPYPGDIIKDEAR